MMGNMNNRLKDAELIIKSRKPVGKTHAINEIHRAGWVMSRPDHIIENGYVKIENGMITEVSAFSYPDDSKFTIIDHGDGVLMPGLFNAHLHLELSALKGKVPFEDGFRSWVRQLLNKRENTGEKILREKAEEALKNMMDSGTLFGAEISTLGITEDIVKNSPFMGIWFKELLGSADSVDFSLLENFLSSSESGKSETHPASNNCHEADLNCVTMPLNEHRTSICSFVRSELFHIKDYVSKDFYLSIAGHAPHTSSPLLLKKIKKILTLKKLIFSIHCAESDDESEFLKQAKGPWADFLKERGIDFSLWPIPAASPVQYLFKLGLLDPLTILVHLLNMNEKDFEIISDSGAKPVLCPRSNMNLHGKLPDIPKFLKMGLKPALGTDSPASCYSLSIFDEMAFVAEHFPDIAPGDIIEMATINGAYALGMEKIAGSLEKGKTAGFIYLPIKALNKDDLFEKISTYSDSTTS